MATHCTEADIADQHIATARELGMDVSGFLMMSHLAEPEELAARTRLVESYGAHCVYVTDSGGRLTPDGIREGSAPTGTSSTPASRSASTPTRTCPSPWPTTSSPSRRAVTRVDASLAGHGAGAGNCPIEPFIAGATLQGWQHGRDLFALQDAADDCVRPLQD